MTRTKTPMAGQGELFPLPSPMAEIRQTDKRVAFGRVVMPYFLGIKQEFDELSPSLEAAANPDNFLPYLLPASGGNYTVDGVALDSQEYSRIIRSPKGWESDISNKTLNARVLDNDSQRNNDFSSRSVLHSLEARLPSMQRTLNGIAQEREALGNLLDQAKHPGYAHKKATDMTTWARMTHSFYFKRILDVVGREKSWTTDQHELASKVVDHRLFYSGKNRVAYWRSMLEVSDDYAQERQKLFKARSEWAFKKIGQLAIDKS